MTHWIQTTDGDPLAAALYRRHYSCRQYQDGRRDDPTNRNRNLFVGPGEKLVLVTPDYAALFVWRKFIDKSGQFGVNCAVFRNESTILASELIKDACSWAWQRWPGQRLYTYVDANAIQSTNPGYCFRRAGWQRCGISKKRKLIILELYPEEVILSTLTRRNPLAAQADITLASETNSKDINPIKPHSITIDPGLQTRDKVNQETIAEYAEAMREGAIFPPLVVYQDSLHYLLAKGFHRLQAHLIAFGPDEPIRCKVIRGERRDALRDALGDNADHGLRLNREDKRKKIKIALADAEWGQWSDREIAKLCKVSHPLVAEVRREVTGNSSSDNGQRTYTNKHGGQSTMNTERIRQANSARSSTAAANDDAGGRGPFAAVIKQIGIAEPDALKPPPRLLTIDETLAVILRFIERGCNSAAPGLQLDFLCRNTEPRAYLPAVNPGRTLDSKCFREAWHQAEALLDAEVKKAARSSTIIQRIETEYDTANPLAPPVTVPEPVEGAVTAIALPPFPVKDAQQFLGQTRRAISTLEEEGWSAVADFLRAVCRMAENQPTEQNTDSPPRTRSQHINQMLSHYRTVIDLLPDYGELTGDYSGTLPLRRALEPMIRKLEENLV